MEKANRKQTKIHSDVSPGRSPKRKALWLSLLGLSVIAVIAGIFLAQFLYPTSMEAPEAGKILEAQAGMPFQILIPSYLPKQFNRAQVDLKLDEAGPGGEPMVQLTYQTARGVTLFVREWVPVNPAMEVLAASRPIQTKWGRGWLLAQGKSLTALWVDIGPLRASVYTSHADQLSKEQILAMADSLGPASNRQVFSFVVDPPKIREVPPPPPFEVPVNEQGIQELTLVVTPGGYTPLRFAVKKDLPVRLHFKQLGQVGCGNELIFPSDPQNPQSTVLLSKGDFKDSD